ncbi:MAG TPA: cysteine hydrolase family protein [Anaerolineales bacterium]|jgi:nicotinamidase-related amidase|nr:cysteine hydrolase family protein [Anaerolineales bacterium]
MKTALLIIDIQKDHFPGGKMPLVKPLEAAQKAYMLLQCFREQGGKHIHIQHISKNHEAGYFISGDHGTDIHDSAAHFEGEPIVYKHEPDAFLDTELPDLLKSWQIERLVICGMMTHLDVDATARAAAQLGFQVIIAEDACATRDLREGETIIPAEEVQRRILKVWKSFGKVMKTEEILALLAAEIVK